MKKETPVMGEAKEHRLKVKPRFQEFIEHKMHRLVKDIAVNNFKVSEVCSTTVLEIDTNVGVLKIELTINIDQ
jgi:hypothetical protein